MRLSRFVVNTVIRLIPAETMPIRQLSTKPKSIWDPKRIVNKLNRSKLFLNFKT